MTRRSLSRAWFFLLLVPPSTSAQQPDHADVWPGHSSAGEVFNDGPRQKAYLMGKTGNVRFPVTTASPDAQQFFEQGVGQLHGFWYFEAERSFRQVALLDSDCAMAYWGMAMANHENEKRAAGFIRKARPLLVNTTRREQLYIESMTDLLLAGGDRRKRQQQCLDTLRKIWQENPADIEAKAFYVVRAWQWKLGGATPTLDRMLDDVFKVNPFHPAHHYRIHGQGGQVGVLWPHAPVRAAGAVRALGRDAQAFRHDVPGADRRAVRAGQTATADRPGPRRQGG
jgi:hypothetical protein